MSQSPKKKNAQARVAAPPPSGPRPQLSRRRLWAFRLAAMVLAPLLVFLLLEAGLRIAGSGYPTSFLLSSHRGTEKTFIQNNQFSWRFFGRQMARTPTPLCIPQVKPAGTIRIFVFGESAANGDPQPRFGLPRLIEAMLNARHPGVRFEVVNAAMTSINSHTIVPIARDCAKADGDLWVVYMGNNEVVGPFGAGTIFGSQTPALPLIRATLAFKTTRSGQWLDSLRQKLRPPPSDKTEWGGMMMFLDHQIPADDPRMERVYHHFEQNLSDILSAGRRRGVGIVVSTVAVNLKDCAPFGSAHRAGLSAPDQARWEELYRSGLDFETAGNFQAAASRFKEAARIDDRVAELRFRQAHCALTLGDLPSAQRDFRAACDLDTLRFRCDSRLNDLTRRAATGREHERILFADAEQFLAQQSPDGLPGSDFFYEHVHLTFEGNYLLARVIVPQIEKLLPEATSRNAANDWPSLTDCAARLGWTDWNLRSALADILARITDPPFTGQLNHNTQLLALKGRMQQLAPAEAAAGVNEARKICEAAVATAPADPWLHGELASLLQAAGDVPGAVTEARRAVDLLPSNSAGWSELGYLLAQLQKFNEAAVAFRQAFALDSQDVWALQNLAQALMKLNRRDEAIREYQRALAIKPRFGLAWLGLGQAYEELGRKAEAEECYRKALANRIHRAAELTTLARFCQSRGWLDAAVTNYADALLLEPLNAGLHIEAGLALAALGRPADAGEHYAEAARLAPDLMQAHFLYGLELGRQGKSAEAAGQFAEAVRLRPDLVQARQNLATALMNDGKNAEALAQFEAVLAREPTNALALRYAELLRKRLADANGSAPRKE